MLLPDSRCKPSGADACAGERGRDVFVALRARARDELGLDEDRLARPFQAAWTFGALIAAGSLPRLAVAVTQAGVRLRATVVVMLSALGLLGDLDARLGGAPRRSGVVSCGAVAMAITSGSGALVGTLPEPSCPNGQSTRTGR